MGIRHICAENFVVLLWFYRQAPSAQLQGSYETFLLILWVILLQMKKTVTWNVEGVASMPDIDGDALASWLGQVAALHGRELGPLNYIFCDDPRSIEVNRQFLGHDYFTDIITFDYSSPRRVSGDMYISLDTVASNAELVGSTYEDELHRVIVHGLLHLCGINDKGPGEREIMERAENEALALLNA